jgi:hypothetical protein
VARRRCRTSRRDRLQAVTPRVPLAARPPPPAQIRANQRVRTPRQERFPALSTGPRLVHHPASEVVGRGLSGFLSRHRCTAAAWHRRHQLDNPSRIFGFGGNRSQGPVSPHLEHLFARFNQQLRRPGRIDTAETGFFNTPSMAGEGFIASRRSRWLSSGRGRARRGACPDRARRRPPPRLTPLRR